MEISSDGSGTFWYSRVRVAVHFETVLVLYLHTWKMRIIVLVLVTVRYRRICRRLWDVFEAPFLVACQFSASSIYRMPFGN